MSTSLRLTILYQSERHLIWTSGKYKWREIKKKKHYFHRISNNFSTILYVITLVNKNGQ